MRQQDDKREQQPTENKGTNALLEALDDAVISMDENFRIFSWNSAAERIYGWKAAEVLGKPFQEIIKPQRENLSSADIILDTRERGFFRGEVAQRHKSGGELALEMRTVALLDDAGQATGYVSINRDTSRLRQAQEKVRESERRWRSLLENVRLLAVNLNTEGIVTYVNPHFLAVTGYSLTDLIGKDWFENFVPEECRVAARKTFEDLVEREEQASNDHPVRKKSGDLIDVNWFNTTLHDPSGQVIGIQSLGEDITVRKKAEEYAVFQDRILSQVQDAVVVTNNDDEITLWNRAAERLYGLPATVALGRKLSETILSNWILPDHHRSVDAAIREKGYWQGTAIQRHSGGEELHVEMTIGDLRDDQRNSIGRMTVARDITEMKRLESELMHSQKLTSMGRLAAGVAHELKSPIAVISGYADTLFRQKNLPKEFKDQIATLKAQSLRCSNLIDHLLDFSRKEKVASQETFDVADAFQFPLSLIAPRASRSNVQVRKEFESGAMKVLGYKDMFEQVIINLSLNAIDAMVTGGTLTLRTKRLVVKDRPLLRVEIADTGPGMSADIQKRIFEPFYTTKAKGEGTGLGLWMAKQIVEALDGTIECGSEEGKGTVFIVTIPLSRDSK